MIILPAVFKEIKCCRYKVSISDSVSHPRDIHCHWCGVYPPRLLVYTYLFFLNHYMYNFHFARGGEKARNAGVLASLRVLAISYLITGWSFPKIMSCTSIALGALLQPLE